MKLNDWEILQCVQRTEKSTIEGKGREAKKRPVDVVPLDPGRDAAQRWKKVLDRKTAKDH